jgi:hypothetical protein
MLPVAIDDDRLAVTIQIAIMVATSLDHDSLVAIAVFTLADHFTVAVAVAMTAANGNAYAGRTNTNAHSDVFRTSRHHNRNSSHRDGSHYKTLDHRLLLSMKLLRKQFVEM